MVNRLSIFLTGKKQRYAFYSVLIFLGLMGVAFTQGRVQIASIAFTLLISLIGAYLTQYENVGEGNLLYILLLPLHLVSGATLSLLYFPNLGDIVKIGAVVFVGGLAYLISLVNNIFLVVVDREETIPLYRVAVTWAQILIVTVAIPYFTGIYKLPVNIFIQSLVVASSTFLLSTYSMWVTLFDKDVRPFTVGDKLLNSLFIVFLVVSSSFGVSFFPTEPFLHSLFISAILMLGLGYLQAHSKNKVTRKLIFEYFLIVLIFLSIVVLFRP